MYEKEKKKIFYNGKVIKSNMWALADDECEARSEMNVCVIVLAEKQK